jgi:DNA-binding helix-hairpin-helix protein with protein kinase domain
MQLEAEREKNQRHNFLDGIYISKAKIPSIADTRKTVLASYGIETAADVVQKEILQISGFGPAITGKLMAWRMECEKKFRFNPNEPIDPKAVSDLDQRISSSQQQFVKELQQGPGILTRQKLEISASRQRLSPLLQKAWLAYKVAEAKRKSL